MLTPGSPRIPKSRPSVYLIDKILKIVLAHPASLGHAGELQRRIFHADVGIEAAAGCVTASAGTGWVSGKWFALR